MSENYISPIEQLKNQINNVYVGRRTRDGGEIFNDYTNNQANADCAVAMGKQNEVNATGGFAAGQNNLIDDLSDNSAVFGCNNELEGKNNLVAGTENTITGNNNISVGSNNTLKFKTETNPSVGNIIAGRDNTIMGDNNLVVGTNHHVSDTIDNAIIAGDGAKVDENTVFAVGQGVYTPTNDQTPAQGLEYYTKDENNYFHKATDITAFDPNKTYYTQTPSNTLEINRQGKMLINNKMILPQLAAPSVIDLNYWGRYAQRKSQEVDKNENEKELQALPNEIISSCLISDTVACLLLKDSGNTANKLVFIDLIEKTVIEEVDDIKDDASANVLIGCISISFNKKAGYLYLVRNSQQAIEKKAIERINLLTSDGKIQEATISWNSRFSVSSDSGELTPLSISCDNTSDYQYISTGDKIYRWLMETKEESPYRDTMVAQVCNVISDYTMAQVYDNLIYYVNPSSNNIYVYDLTGNLCKIFNLPDKCLGNYNVGILRNITFDSNGQAFIFTSWSLDSSYFKVGNNNTNTGKDTDAFRYCYNCLFTTNLYYGIEKSQTINKVSTVIANNGIKPNTSLASYGDSEYPFTTLDEVSMYAQTCGQNSIAIELIAAKNVPDSDKQDWYAEGLQLNLSATINGYGQTINYLEMLNGKYMIDELIVSNNKWIKPQWDKGDTPSKTAPVYIENANCNFYGDQNNSIDSGTSYKCCIYMIASTIIGTPTCVDYNSNYAVYGEKSSRIEGCLWAATNDLDDKPNANPPIKNSQQGDSIANAYLDGRNYVNIMAALSIGAGEETSILSTCVDETLSNSKKLPLITYGGNGWSYSFRMNSWYRDEYNGGGLYLPPYKSEQSKKDDGSSQVRIVHVAETNNCKISVGSKFTNTGINFFSIS